MEPIQIRTDKETVVFTLDEIPALVIKRIKANLKEPTSYDYSKIFVQKLDYDYLPKDWKYVVTVEGHYSFNIFNNKGCSIISDKCVKELKQLKQNLGDYLFSKSFNSEYYDSDLKLFIDSTFFTFNKIMFRYAAQDYVTRRIVGFFESDDEASYYHKKPNYTILKIYNPYPIY